MVPAAPALAPPSVPEYIGVHLDGRPIGFVEQRSAPRLANRLRSIKAACLASQQGRSLPGLPSLQVRFNHPCLSSFQSAHNPPLHSCTAEQCILPYRVEIQKLS